MSTGQRSCKGTRRMGGEDDVDGSLGEAVQKCLESSHSFCEAATAFSSGAGKELNT